MIKLGVNIDHVATIRQARGGIEPEPVTAAGIAELAGAHGITIHLREDRRHIQDRDVAIIKQTVQTRLNLEMGNAPEIVEIALKTQPYQCTLVPEKREELTTEGGLDVVTHFDALKKTVSHMHDAGITVSLFIDPDEEQVTASKETGAEFIELHTGCFANAQSEVEENDELFKLVTAAEKALSCGLRVNAGHGLNYINVLHMHMLPGLEELNIGHSIIARAVFVGLERAVKEMIELLKTPVILAGEQ